MNASTGRATHMGRSVAAALRLAEVGGPRADLIHRAHELAMEPRVERLDDDHHPAYLHPGRSVLILLRDVGPSAAGSLALAAVHESGDGWLRVDEQALARLDATLADERARLPLPGDERLAEKLLELSEAQCLAVIAERLDHLRHLHLREDLEPWSIAHEETGRVWLPIAQRSHPVLGGRMAHWVRTFARRVG